MRVLVACEFSGVVREAFNSLAGVHAMSCDLLPAEDGRVDYHIQGDVLEHLNDGWDLMIAHPPCTYLTNAGVRHLHSIPTRTRKLPAVHGTARREALREGAEFFKALLHAPIPYIAVENPIPHKYAVEIIGRKYDQLIQPWMFGHGETKATCLWLKNLPRLEATHRKNDLFAQPEPIGRVQRLHRLPPSPDRWKLRSTTYAGIARAMADQWGEYVLSKLEYPPNRKT